VPFKRIVINNELSCFDDIHHQWDIGSIEDNQIDLIGIQDIHELPQDFQFGFGEIGVWL
jgi:hypothetical protein